MPQFSDDLFLGTAQTFMGLSYSSTECAVVGSISGTTLTVTSLLSGDPVTVGSFIGRTGYLVLGNWLLVESFGKSNSGT